MLNPCLAVAVLLAAPAAASPQAPAVGGDTLQLDLETARQVGLASRPQLQAARARLDAAVGRRRQAGAYPFNPRVQIKASALVDPGDRGPLEAQFTQEIEWAGQWSLRKGVADAGVAVARDGVGEAARTGLYEIDAAFHRAVAAARQLAVRERGLDLSRRLADAVQIQLREGKVSELEANLARIEAGRAYAAAGGARREWVAALLALRVTLGLTADRPLRIVGDGAAGPDPGALDADSLVAAALASRPDLSAAEARVERWHAEARLAGRLTVPNLSVSAVAERGALGEPLRWGLQVGVPLPFWNRNGGMRDAARGEEAAAEADRLALELQVRSEVMGSLAAYRSTREELETFDAQVLGPARANQRLLETAFDSGRLDLPTVLLLRTQLLEAEIGYWDTWLADRTAYAALRAAIGGASADALPG